MIPCKPLDRTDQGARPSPPGSAGRRRPWSVLVLHARAFPVGGCAPPPGGAIDGAAEELEAARINGESTPAGSVRRRLVRKTHQFPPPQPPPAHHPSGSQKPYVHGLYHPRLCLVPSKAPSGSRPIATLTPRLPCVTHSLRRIAFAELLRGRPLFIGAPDACSSPGTRYLALKTEPRPALDGPYLPRPSSARCWP